MGIGRGGGDAQRLELCARGGFVIAIEVFGFQMVLIDGPLVQTHRHAVNMADLLNDGLADVLFAPANLLRLAHLNVPRW
jgi:hypothetical protein